MPVITASAGSLKSKPSLAARSLRMALALGAMGAFAYVFAYAYIEGTAKGEGRMVPDEELSPLGRVWRRMIVGD